MAEGKIFAITGFGGGLSVGVQGDSPEEFNQLVQALRQAAVNDPVLAQLFAPVVGIVQGGPSVNSVPNEAQAIAHIQQAFPQAQVSTVGQPLPQPTVTATPAPVAGPVAGASSAPPGVAYPGNCPHGERIYNDKPARGKAWRRFECALPWKPGADNKEYNKSRCDSINVEN